MESKTSPHEIDEKKESTLTSERKLAHLQICLEHDVQGRNITTGLEDISFVHHATTDLNMEDIDLSIELFGKKLQFPLVISGMTGGHAFSQQLNDFLSQVAEKKHIGMGVGSQRAALEDAQTRESFEIVKENAPKTLKIGNIGAGQIVEGLTASDLQDIVSMISADAVAIHFNPLQESIQPEGDTNLQKLMDHVSLLIKKSSTPIIAKEVGSGFSRFDIARIKKSGFKGIDVQGAGGTSWAGVESIRAEDPKYKKAGEIFWDWGIPTTVSTIFAKNNFSGHIIGSGGVRNGLEVAKLLALGADAAGMAIPFLFAIQDNSMENSLNFIEEIGYQIRLACFLTGSKNIDDLKSTPLVITGKTAELLRAYGIDPKEYSSRPN
ncbi:MAG: type 2 isopentenyl-diphosphate Delta-isomerase [Candidatus Hodarchaeales archaeon]|jgi:isopentenyl-diphosphate delta-isomerase